MCYKLIHNDFKGKLVRVCYGHHDKASKTILTFIIILWLNSLSLMSLWNEFKEHEFCVVFFLALRQQYSWYRLPYCFNMNILFSVYWYRTLWKKTKRRRKITRDKFNISIWIYTLNDAEKMDNQECPMKFWLSWNENNWIFWGQRNKHVETIKYRTMFSKWT